MSQSKSSHGQKTGASPATKSPLVLIPFVVLIALMASTSAPLRSQCSVVYSTEIIPNPDYAVVVRVFSGSSAAVGPCATTMSNNAFICQPTNIGSGVYNCANTMGCQGLLAAATGVTTNPQSHSCGFSCGGCGQQVIDNSDGLPVELMGFGIEGDALDDDGRSDPGAKDSQTEGGEVDSRS